jgi:hypothetical protein
VNCESVWENQTTGRSGPKGGSRAATRATSEDVVVALSMVDDRSAVS